MKFYCNNYVILIVEAIKTAELRQLAYMKRITDKRLPKCMDDKRMEEKGKTKTNFDTRYSSDKERMRIGR